MLKKILVVDILKSWLKQWKEDFEGKMNFFSAPSFEEAERILVAHPDMAIIATVPRLNSDLVNARSFVAKVKKTFQGPMILISNHEVDYRLVGEVYTNGCKRCDLVETVLGIIHKEDG